MKLFKLLRLKHSAAQCWMPRACGNRQDCRKCITPHRKIQPHHRFSQCLPWINLCKSNTLCLKCEKKGKKKRGPPLCLGYPLTSSSYIVCDLSRRKGSLFARKRANSPHVEVSAQNGFWIRLKAPAVRQSRQIFFWHESECCHRWDIHSHWNATFT